MSNSCIDEGSVKSKIKLSVAFVLLPEFTLSALAGFIDTLRLSASDLFSDEQKYCSWSIVGSNKTAVRSSCGVEVVPWDTFRSRKSYDCVVVIGGQVRGHRYISPEILNYIRDANNQNCVLIGICTGSFALAYAGMMKDKTACVHWFHLPHYIKEFPNHKADSTALFHIDGNCITCAGGGVSQDVAVHVISQFCGSLVAQKGISGMLMDSPRDLQSFQPLFDAKWFLEIRNICVRRAVLLMGQYIQDPISISDLAKLLGVSYNTINRCFGKELGVTCSYFYRAYRIAHGFWEVVHTNKNITNISIDFGFSDTSHFIKVFHQYYNKTPSNVRNFGHADLNSFLSQISENHSPVIGSMLKGELLTRA